MKIKQLLILGISNQHCFIKSLTFILLFLMFFIKSGFSQSLGLNTTDALPDSSAMLDIISANKGLLIPRISLTSTTDTTTISHPATSLLVYNTNAAITGGSGLGYYYFNDSMWVNFLSGTISSLTIPLLVGGSSTTSSLTYKPTTGIGTTGADHIFQVGNNGATEALRILNNGNVGIGETNPDKLLTLNHSGVIGWDYDGSTHISYHTISGGGTNPMAFKVGSFSANTAVFTFAGNVSTPIITILNGGNVGIGTTGPNTKFEANTSTGSGRQLIGGFLAGGNATGNGASVAVGSNQTYCGFITGLQTATNEGDLTFGTQSAGNYSEKMRILGNTGNIGIGTISPSQKLEVSGGNIRVINFSTAVYSSVGTIPANSLFLNNSSVDGEFGGIMVGASNVATQQQYGYFGAVSNSSGYQPDLVIGNISGAYGANTEFIRIKTGGSIGIGVTSPSAKLHTISTTEQMRLGYDASNYFSTTISSTGGVTYDAVGAGSAFTFSDAVNLPTGSVGVTQSANDSTTKFATTAFVDRAMDANTGNSITNDTTTNQTMFPVWVTSNTGNLPLKVSSTRLSFNPSNGTLIVKGTINALTVGLGASSIASNTAIGFQPLYSNTTGALNTANGYSSLYSNTTGSANTSNGYHTLFSNTTGDHNTSFGYSAIYANTTGTQNTAIGSLALNANITGANNTASGMQSLWNNTTGYDNVANGYAASASNTTACCNTAIGTYSLYYNEAGAENVALGEYSLVNNTASYNTGIGFYAGVTNTTGTNITCLGHAADVSTAGLYNATAIGNAASVNASNKVRIGDANVTVIEGQVSFTSVSDGRFKKNISESDVKGLPFIMRLRPVAYNLDTRQYEEFLIKNKPDSIKIKHFKNRDFTASTAIRHSGFIAQEVEVAAQETNYDFNGLHKPENADDNYGLAYSEFVVPLVKAVQEQQKLITDQQLIITSKDSVLASLQNQIDQLTILIQQIQNPKKSN